MIRRPILWRFLVEIGSPDFGIGAVASAQRGLSVMLTQPAPSVSEFAVGCRPIVSRKTSLLTFLSLLGLTLLTTLLGYADMGPLNTLVAVALATVKACLIAAFFMHALYEVRIVRVVMAGGVVWFLIFISLTISDYISRGWLGT